MNELFDAILASPNDAKRYAVYGDWLQSQGDRLGELVSVQVALTSTTDPKRFVELKASQDRLLAEVAPAAVPLGDARAKVSLKWRWGFVQELALSPLGRAEVPASEALGGLLSTPDGEGALLSRLLALPACRLVQTLKLWPAGNDVGPYVSALAQSKPPVLTRLVLHGAAPIARLADAFPRLEHLSIGFQGPIESGSLSRFSELRSLELSDVEGKAALAGVLRSAPWKKLKRLRLRVNDIHGDDLRAALALPELREVAVSANLQGAGAAVAESPRLKELTELMILDNSTDETVQTFLPRRGRLEKLKLVIEYGELSAELVRKLRKAVKGVVLRDVEVYEHDEAGVHVMDAEEARDWRDRQERLHRAGDYNHDDWN